MVYLDLIIVLILICINGFFAMCELAVVSSNRIRLENLARSGNRGARAAIDLIDNPGRFLSTVQIGITLVGIAAGAFSAETLGTRLGDWLDTTRNWVPHGRVIGIGFTVLIVTYLSLTIGELVPKRIALSQPEWIAAKISIPMHWLSRTAAPIVWLLQYSTDKLLRVFASKTQASATVTEEEVRALIAHGTQMGVFLPQEQELIDGVLSMADRPVRAIMTPRPHVIWVDAKAGRLAIESLVDVHRYSRLLVCDGVIDRPLGIVHTRDLLPAALRGPEIDLKELIRPVIFVPSRTPVLRLLHQFKQDKVHLAVVIDEYGATQGLVTLNDILESVAGDLPDQVNLERPWISPQGTGAWLVDGFLPTDELETVTGIRSGKEVQTVAGLVLEQLGRLPVEGSELEYQGANFRIVRMDGFRIAEVLIRIQKNPLLGLRPPGTADDDVPGDS